MTPAVAAVAAMYAAFMAVGWIASRRVRGGTAADLIVADRAMPLWVAALTMTATWVDGGSLLGTTEGVYKSSVQLGIQGGLCFGLSLILGGALFASIVAWWDTALMLLLGGIPWNCYFQRVLSCRTPADARRKSVLAGALTIALTAPPLLMGVAAFAYPWPAEVVDRLSATPADAMPLLFARAVPPAIGLLGLAAIIGAVTSSFSSSILSAGSMLSWPTARARWRRSSCRLRCAWR